ncbi:hypothetical protein JB92DRAFT_2941756, partial [Gautieria morchelliformis]
MVPLITDMTQEEPSKRPSIDEVVTRFETIYWSLSFKLLCTRIVARKEDEGTSVVYDFISSNRCDMLSYEFLLFHMQFQVWEALSSSPAGNATP